MRPGSPRTRSLRPPGTRPGSRWMPSQPSWRTDPTAAHEPASQPGSSASDRAGPRRRAPSQSALAPRPAAGKPAGPSWRSARLLVLATSLAAYAYAGTGLAILAVAGWAVGVDRIPAHARADSTRGADRAVLLAEARATAASSDSGASARSCATRPRRWSATTSSCGRPSSTCSPPGWPSGTASACTPSPRPPGGSCCHRAREDALWFWLDPQRPAQTEQGRSGIPPRTLAAILDRLERL